MNEYPITSINAIINNYKGPTLPSTDPNDITIVVIAYSAEIRLFYVIYILFINPLFNTYRQNACHKKYICIINALINNTYDIADNE